MEFTETMAVGFSTSAAFPVDTATDSSSHVASSSSTPPTSIDLASLASEPEPSKPRHGSPIAASEIIALPELDDDLTPSQPAPRPASLPPPQALTPLRGERPAITSYNLAQLEGAPVLEKRPADDDAVDSGRSPKRRQSERSAIDALEPHWSPRRQRQRQQLRESPRASPRTLRESPRAARPIPRGKTRESPRTTRVSSRLASASTESPAEKPTATAKKGKKRVLGKGTSRMSRELLRLQDTKEFAHVDEQPVVHTVWSNGKLIDDRNPPPAKSGRGRKAQQAPSQDQDDVVEESAVEVVAPKRRRAKKYLEKGLYAGQAALANPSQYLTTAEKKRLAQIPELTRPSQPNKILPLPMFNGLRLLINGRDFKLPYSVCNPLPPGQPKPDEWRKMTKNRFIGDSLLYWKKSPYLADISKCICKPQDGCGEDCQNRIMLYECDEGNCAIGKEQCTNRAFADLADRKAKGGKYRIGVEVVKTSDRGYGVRANRSFQPNQIIMEYTGEIITVDECDRRMNELYKDNECYYLMSFDQNMIIDATTGSIARFVNHSCNPNCRMIKWIVKGEPRMALFAGDRPISTGDELTYDYNFDPFSQKNVQKCLCGEKNCRGILGPKPKDIKLPKADLKETTKTSAKSGGKRKRGEAAGEAGRGKAAKKRKMVKTTKTKPAIAKPAKKKAAVGSAKKSATVQTASSRTTKAKGPGKGKGKKVLTATLKGKAKAPRAAGKAAATKKGAATTSAKGIRASKPKPASKTASKVVKIARTTSVAKARKGMPKSVNRISAVPGKGKVARVSVSKRSGSGTTASTKAKATRKTTGGRIVKPNSKSSQPTKKRQAKLAVHSGGLSVVTSSDESRIRSDTSPEVKSAIEVDPEPPTKDFIEALYTFDDSD